MEVVGSRGSFRAGIRGVRVKNNNTNLCRSCRYVRSPKIDQGKFILEG